MMWYVYVYRDARPSEHRVPRWIGKGTGNRAYARLRPRARNNPFLSRIIREHRALGLEPHTEIVKRFATELEALAYEVVLIAKYGRLNIGTGSLANMTVGGEGMTLSAIRRRLFKKLRSTHMLKRWKNKKYAQAAIALLDEMHADPKWRTARSKTMSALNKDPIFQVKRRTNWNKRFSDPQFMKRRNAKISATASRRQRDANGRFIPNQKRQSQ